MCVCVQSVNILGFFSQIFSGYISDISVNSVYITCVYCTQSENIWDGNKVDQHPWPGFNPQNEIPGHRRSSFVKPGMKNCSPI